MANNAIIILYYCNPPDGNDKMMRWDEISEEQRSEKYIDAYELYLNDLHNEQDDKDNAMQQQIKYGKCVTKYYMILSSV